MRLSITHSQAGLCCIGPPSARPGTFYEMLHTATLAPFSNPKTNPRRTGVSFPPAPPSIATSPKLQDFKTASVNVESVRHLNLVPFPHSLDP